MVLTASVALPQDTFVGRTVAGNTNASSWGTASNSVDAWTAISGTGGSTTFAVASGEGTLTCVSSNVIILTLGNESWTDMGVLARMKASNANNTLDIFVRITDSTHYYRAAIVMNTGQSLAIGMKNGGGFVSLASGTPPYTPAVNTFIWIRLQAIGNVISAKTWLDGNSEPAAWTVTYTDLSSTFLTGGVGMGANTSTASDVDTFDSFSSYPIYTDSNSLLDSVTYNPSPTPTDGQGSYVATVLADGPFAYYRLNEASGTTAFDSSGNGYNGTIGSGVTLGQASIFPGTTDTAMLFNGTSTGLITLPQSAFPTGGANWSIEGWAKPAAFQSTNGSIAGFGKYTHFNAAEVLFLHETSSALKLDTTIFNADASQAGNYVTNLTTYHVVGTYDGTTIRLYVNGVQAGTNVNTPNIIMHFANIGAGDGTDYLNATISHVAFYSFTLSAAQVLNHYQIGSRGGTDLQVGESISKSSAQSFTDSNSLVEASTSTDAPSFIDSNTLIENSTETSAPSLTDNNSLLENLTELSVVMFTDGGSLVEASTSTGVPTLADSTSLVDAAANTGIVVLIDQNSILDNITIVDWPPAYIVSSRNGSVTVSSRNGATTTSSRSGSVTVSSRNEAITTSSRNGSVTVSSRNV